MHRNELSEIIKVIAPPALTPAPRRQARPGKPPPITPQPVVAAAQNKSGPMMRLRTVAEVDLFTWERVCQDCGRAFGVGEVVFESVMGQFHLHVACVADMYRRSPANREELHAAYERCRDELTAQFVPDERT